MIILTPTDFVSLFIFALTTRKLRHLFSVKLLIYFMPGLAKFALYFTCFFFLFLHVVLLLCCIITIGARGQPARAYRPNLNLQFVFAKLMGLGQLSMVYYANMER